MKYQILPMRRRATITAQFHLISERLEQAKKRQPVYNNKPVNKKEMKEKNQNGQTRKQNECAILCAKNEENYLQEKMAIANGFTIIEQDECLEDDEKMTLRGLLCNYNGLIDAVNVDEVFVAGELERRLMRLGGIVSLYMAVNDVESVAATLECLENTLDGNQQDVLHDVVTMIKQFCKEK